MADQEQLAAFAYHWRAAGLAETTLRYYLSWLRRLGVDDAATEDWLAAQLADMTPSQRPARAEARASVAGGNRSGEPLGARGRGDVVGDWAWGSVRPTLGGRT